MHANGGWRSSGSSTLPETKWCQVNDNFLVTDYCTHWYGKRTFFCSRKFKLNCNSNSSSHCHQLVHHRKLPMQIRLTTESVHSGWKELASFVLYVCKAVQLKSFQFDCVFAGQKEFNCSEKKKKKRTGKSKKVNGILNERGEREVGKAVQFSFELLLLLNWITTTDVSVSFLSFFYEMKCTPYNTNTHSLKCFQFNCWPRQLAPPTPAPPFSPLIARQKSVFLLALALCVLVNPWRARRKRTGQ